ncbi:MAG: hypothetical protein Q9181_002916 [Wetmoreana brouardii]
MDPRNGLRVQVRAEMQAFWSLVERKLILETEMSDLEKQLGSRKVSAMSFEEAKLGLTTQMLLEDCILNPNHYASLNDFDLEELEYSLGEVETKVVILRNAEFLLRKRVQRIRAAVRQPEITANPQSATSIPPNSSQLPVAPAVSAKTVKKAVLTKRPAKQIYFHNPYLSAYAPAQPPSQSPEPNTYVPEDISRSGTTRVLWSSSAPFASRLGVEVQGNAALEELVRLSTEGIS